MDLKWGLDKPERQLHLGGSRESSLANLHAIFFRFSFDSAFFPARGDECLHSASLQVGTKLAITTSVLQQGRVTGLLETRIVNE